MVRQTYQLMHYAVVSEVMLVAQGFIIDLITCQCGTMATTCMSVSMGNHTPELKNVTKKCSQATWDSSPYLVSTLSSLWEGRGWVEGGREIIIQLCRALSQNCVSFLTHGSRKIFTWRGAENSRCSNGGRMSRIHKGEISREKIKISDA